MRGVLLSGLLLTLGCGDTASPNPSGGDAGLQDAGPPLGADTLGASCTGGCGADDDRKCTTGTSDCPLCMVDPGHVALTYCSQDCTTQPCPIGWTCEAVKAFGQDDVTQACVADTAVCGDGVVQLGERCDGDDPMLGRCVDCGGYEAVCGDGVVQMGEVCDGDDPMLGRCVDCQRYEGVCGDGVIQMGETCDGDGPEGYCIDCQRLEAPRLELLIRPNTSVRGVERNEANMTWYYNFTFDQMTTDLTLPTAGDADGCGRVEVVETTSDATRVAFTLCGGTGGRWGRSTWTVGFPRAENIRVRSADANIPDVYRPRHLVESLDGQYRLAWDLSHARIFDLSTFQTEVPAFTRGNMTLWLEQPDPIASFARASARLEIGFRILHPMAER